MKGNVMKRILVVDDLKDLRDTIVEYLEAMGFDVIESENGLIAKENLEKHKFNFDVVITDLGMPKMNGYELVQYIRSKNTSIPIIVISGLENQTEKEFINELQDQQMIQFFFEKPITLLKVKEKIDELL